MPKRSIYGARIFERLLTLSVYSESSLSDDLDLTKEDDAPSSGKSGNPRGEAAARITFGTLHLRLFIL